MPVAKMGKWIRAHRVRVVKKNGRRTIEVQRVTKRRTVSNRRRRRAKR